MDFSEFGISSFDKWGFLIWVPFFWVGGLLIGFSNLGHLFEVMGFSEFGFSSCD